MIKILNRSRQPIAILENAHSVSYKKRLNEIWGASFILPLDDPKNKECEPFNYVEIVDDATGEYIGLFRIVPAKTSKSESSYAIQYECDHVIATLLDDVLFKYHQTINWTTRQNIEYILARQTTKHWRLGRCDFTRYFHYKWENENGLLGPLFSIAQPFDQPYEWTFDTTSYPWTLNIVEPQNAVSCEIRYGVNQREVHREVDPTGIINRIYPQGYGEGINQLSIEKVNNGVPYLQDDASISKFGLIPYVWVDRRFEDADSLKASAQALLKERSVPKVSYQVSAADLSSLTGVDAHKLKLGRIVRITDPDLGIIEARIVSEAKKDIVGAPGEIELEIANKTENLGTTQADLERRQQINEVYAQGATNIDSHDYNDNADQNNPASIRFYLPDEMVRVNKLELTFDTSEFRTYGKATEGGGATSTTTSGGGATTATSSSGGGVSTSTASGGGSSQTSSAGGGTQTTTSTRNFSQLNLMSGIPEGLSNAHVHEVQIPGDRFNHSHEITIGSHTHSVSIPSHTHNFNVPNHSHSVSIPNHTHDFTLPDHTHEIQHGIFKLNTTPSRVTIKVDGNTVPHTSTSGQNIDLIPYLGKDSSGRVNRGWHTVEITPNSLGRITAQITTQFFIQSRGGGNF
ncbi:phage tail protein [Cytobacillus sp. Sa5YUA1]|uniref:Phage tail protein n=1 Tax=Cytobacillus stercorigallinarum TaxID=2762240 RepID=A0ABR8QVR1_9BACI|nr:phage tail spike protein [Cytobacillus stercorigallinarum]MBD7939539.1 phage tail protein [Cytobacillus stercorigallinarum]